MVGGMKLWWWGFLTMWLMALSGLWESKMEGADAALTPAQCHLERSLAVKECMPVVYGKLPTPACCERARVSHTECICPAITWKLVAFVDINRAIRLIEGCGRKVPRHFKCGSLTTP